MTETNPPNSSVPRGDVVPAAGPVTIALDAEGGDHAPREIVLGALAAAGPDLRVALVGRPEVVRAELETAIAGFSGDGAKYIEMVSSASVISSREEPARAVRNQPEASISVGARLVADGKAQAFISAGSTGAMLAAGLLLVKRVRGIKRPAILTLLPGEQGPVVFLDAGANADCRPDHLLEFGTLGAVFAHRVLGLENPRVALLNIGEEAGKGNELTVAAHQLLAESGLNFVGNLEGRGLLANAADVVVTDGFTGNVALKLLEGTARSLMLRIRSAAETNLRSKLGGVLLRPALRSMRDELDPEQYGGTYLLGLRGLLVIAHGNSSRTAIENGLRFAAEAVRSDVVAAVREELESQE